MRIFSILIITGMCLLTGFTAEAVPDIPDIPSNMIIDKNSHPYGGDIICIANFDLTQGSASWYASSGASMIYNSLDGNNGCYWLQISNSVYSKCAMSSNTFTIQPNRNYYVSALVYCDYDRDNCEINIGMTCPNGWSYILSNTNGTPAQTGGSWQRFEWMFTSDSRCSSGKFFMEIHNATANDVFCISDLIFIEMPQVPLTPYSPGEGVTFGGSCGGLGMSIVSANSNASTITVTTTGSKYTFDKNNNTIVAEQLINKNRVVSSWSSNKSFANLAIQSQSAKEVVITNNGLTFGVQMDGLLLVSTHSTDLELTCTSGIAGLWNRFASGHLIAMDDIGGFTVNPDIPLGTGRLVRTTVLTSGLDFVNKSRDVNFISNVNAGWQIKWTISPGERLGITTFPPRPYNWQASFNSTTATYFPSTPIGYFATDNSNYGVMVGLLWNFCKRAWGMSYGSSYIPYDVTTYSAYINAAKNAGITPLNYMSMYFWHNRDIDEYITEVTRHRDTYGIEGIYSDGLPCQNWLVAYEGMRRLREVFPNGFIYVHTTGQAANGGPPLAVPDIFIPAIDTYATATLRGETIAGTGKDWTYTRFVTSQYNKANCFGIQKGDMWDIAVEDQDLVNLIYNGRARLARTANFANEYKAILSQLESEWVNNGSQPNFYEAYYAPLARSLTASYLTGYVMEPFVDDLFNANATGNPPSGWQTTCDANTTVTVANVPAATNKSVELYDNNASGKCYISKKFLPVAGGFTFEYKFRSNSGCSELYLKDSSGAIGVSLALIGQYLKYRNSAGNYILVQTVNYNEWHTVKVEANTDTDTYNIYVDGSLAATGTGFYANVYSICEAVFTTSTPTTGTLYLDDIKVGYSPLAPLYDTFNHDTIGNAPRRWNITCDSNVNVTVTDALSDTDKSVKLYDANNSGNGSMSKCFNPLSGNFTFEFKFLTGSNVTEIYLKDSSGNIAVYLAVDAASSALKYHNGQGFFVATQISCNTWNTVRVEGNTNTDSYDIYFNDNLAAAGVDFYANVSSLSEVVFTTSASLVGSIYLNNIKITDDN